MYTDTRSGLPLHKNKAHSRHNTQTLTLLHLYSLQLHCFTWMRTSHTVTPVHLKITVTPVHSLATLFNLYTLQSHCYTSPLFSHTVTPVCAPVTVTLVHPAVSVTPVHPAVLHLSSSAHCYTCTPNSHITPVHPPVTVYTVKALITPLYAPVTLLRLFTFHSLCHALTRFSPSVKHT